MVSPRPPLEEWDKLEDRISLAENPSVLGGCLSDFYGLIETELIALHGVLPADAPSYRGRGAALASVRVPLVPKKGSHLKLDPPPGRWSVSLRVSKRSFTGLKWRNV